MDDVVPVFIIVAAVAAVTLSAAFIGWGSFDTSVVEACRRNGYWQTGQTRITCTVETPPQPSLDSRKPTV